jgi:hypothetical protein
VELQGREEADRSLWHQLRRDGEGMVARDVLPLALV